MHTFFEKKPVLNLPENIMLVDRMLNYLKQSIFYIADSEKPCFHHYPATKENFKQYTPHVNNLARQYQRITNLNEMKGFIMEKRFKDSFTAAPHDFCVIPYNHECINNDEAHIFFSFNPAYILILHVDERDAQMTIHKLTVEQVKSNELCSSENMIDIQIIRDDRNFANLAKYINYYQVARKCAQIESLDCYYSGDVSEIKISEIEFFSSQKKQEFLLFLECLFLKRYGYFNLANKNFKAEEFIFLKNHNLDNYYWVVYCEYSNNKAHLAWREEEQYYLNITKDNKVKIYRMKVGLWLESSDQKIIKKLEDIFNDNFPKTSDNLYSFNSNC